MKSRKMRAAAGKTEDVPCPTLRNGGLRGRRIRRPRARRRVEAHHEGLAVAAHLDAVVAEGACVVELALRYQQHLRRGTYFLRIGSLYGISNHIYARCKTHSTLKTFTRAGSHRAHVGAVVRGHDRLRRQALHRACRGARARVTTDPCNSFNCAPSLF